MILVLQNVEFKCLLQFEKITVYILDLKREKQNFNKKKNDDDDDSEKAIRDSTIKQQIRAWFKRNSFLFWFFSKKHFWNDRFEILNNSFFFSS